jgi:hypothetical protein
VSGLFSHKELDDLVDACLRDLGSPADWIAPDGYPTSMALCVIDAVFSINANYQGVLNVVKRYRRYRRNQRGDADSDGVIELLGTFEHLGGAEAWADEVDNHWRTSTRSGILKAEAVLREAHKLADCNAWTVAAFHDAALDGSLAAIEANWLTVTGQGSGVSWGYVPILARPHARFGASASLVEAYADAVIGVKPDRMIKRYVASAIGSTEAAIPNRKAGALVKEAAKVMNCDVYGLDHTIWRYQSGRLHQTN